MKKIVLVLLAISGAFLSNGQNMAGKIYLTWGYHRDQYTTSTIRFRDVKTDNYDFTFDHAKAKDKPDFGGVFGTPLTVPQYVLNVGVFLPKHPNWGIEFSWDHLKYVVYDNQSLHVHGQIHGVAIDTMMTVTKEFVHFEHTNGNNYAMISVVRKFPLIGNRWSQLSTLVKGGAGGLVPKTDSYIMGKHNDGPFRLSGFVIAASANMRYDLFTYFFLEASIKGAFADYTNAKVYDLGRAHHHFFSVQYIWSAGINVPLYRSPKATKKNAG